LSFTCLSHS